MGFGGFGLYVMEPSGFKVLSVLRLQGFKARGIFGVQAFGFLRAWGLALQGSMWGSGGVNAFG